MSVEKSLLQLILDLLNDPQLLAEFKEDPQGVLASCGLTGVTPDDVYDAIVLAQDAEEVSYDREYHTGSQAAGGAHVPPPHPPVVHPAPGEDPHEAAITYLDEYVTNNHYTYNVDDRDTIVDNSVNQNIDTDGGDFRQDIETTSVTASGDGAVAAGDDIEDSTITTGDDNIVGNDNQVVSGDDNTTAFGSGSAYSAGDVAADDGAAISFGGDADGEKSAEDSFNTRESTTTNETTTSFEDSFNETTDSSRSTVNEDSNNTDVLSNNDVEADVDVVA